MVALFPSPRATPITPKSYGRIAQALAIPSLIQVQVDSFNWFKTEGLRELFTEISPIEDFTGGRFELHFLGHEFHEAKYSEVECREREATYEAPLYVTTRLVVKDTGEIKESPVFLGNIPMMTGNGTFIINGAERVVVSQLVRSPGVYFTTEEDTATGRPLCFAKFVPYRGAWLEFETSARDIISVKVDRKRKIHVTTLLRAIGLASNESLLQEFEAVDINTDHRYIQSTLERDGVHNAEEALIEFYKHLRPGEPPSLENAKSLLFNLFFNPRRYDLGRVGRYKLNRRMEMGNVTDERTLTKNDIIGVVRTMVRINNGELGPDDIDHLGNRRVRAVGELIQNQLRVGLLRMERTVKEKMSISEIENITPAALVNQRPVAAAVREFFGGSQLSQFMDQTNPLAELTHKRRLSALGPGGLSRERAGFDVRDVHHSHYGRICPIETPEGPNIGLLGSMATFARTNEYGFIETPYRKVMHELPNDSHDLEGRTVREAVTDDNGKTVADEGKVITAAAARRIRALSPRTIKMKAFVAPGQENIHYLSADVEEKLIIAQSASALDEKLQFTGERVEIRQGERFAKESPEIVDYVDVSPLQIVSVSTALIPFLEHDDANRALMGSNMQRQAVPLLAPDVPIVGTGMESRVAMDSGQVALAECDGIVTSVDGDRIIITDAEGKEHVHRLKKFVRTNQGTCMNQRAISNKGDIVKKGDAIADSSSTDRGSLALGQNVLVAFMSWEGYNFEDAIILSERVLRDEKFTSIHIEKHECDARDTKLGPEEITRDIPNVGEDSLRNLDEAGIILVGAEVGPGDILVGKITPKGETELTAEEKLLRAIFGEKARDVKDSSMRVPHGERGKVIAVKVLTRENKDELDAGVNKKVRVWIAQTRKISAGDKMAGRHGNKGVISRIMPLEDMPYLPDGTPVDIILNPIGVPSRMNLGQVLETHLGWAAQTLGFRAQTPVFDGAKDVAIQDALARAWFVKRSGAQGHQEAGPIDDAKLSAWLKERGYDKAALWDETKVGPANEACLRLWLKEIGGVDTSQMTVEAMLAEQVRLEPILKDAPPTLGKTILYDGRTGEPFARPVTVGVIYMLKLIHLVEDKIHARSTGPYSLITQQPLGGKAQFGGQRFGEMEVWALEAYSAAHNLQEMLTVKSDDTVGRVKTYESIIKGEDIVQPGVPESFHVLLKELQSLGLSVELMNEGDGAMLLGPDVDEPSEGIIPPADRLLVDQIEASLNSVPAGEGVATGESGENGA